MSTATDLIVYKILPLSVKPHFNFDKPETHVPDLPELAAMYQPLLVRIASTEEILSSERCCAAELLRCREVGRQWFIGQVVDLK